MIEILKDLGKQREQINGETMVNDAINLYSTIESYLQNKHRFTPQDVEHFAQAIPAHAYLFIKSAKQDEVVTSDGLSALLGESGNTILSDTHLKQLMEALAVFLGNRQHPSSLPVVELIRPLIVV